MLAQPPARLMMRVIASGVWRFREFLPDVYGPSGVVTLSEGNTPLVPAQKTLDFAGLTASFLQTSRLESHWIVQRSGHDGRHYGSEVRGREGGRVRFYRQYGGLAGCLCRARRRGGTRLLCRQDKPRPTNSRKLWIMARKRCKSTGILTTL